MKDRLEELRRLSQQQTSNGKQSSKQQFNHDVEKNLDETEKTGLLDPFFSQVEVLKEQLEQLKLDIEGVQKIHSFLLNAKEPDKEVVRQRTNQLDDLNARIRRASIAVKNQLKELRDTTESLESQVMNSTSNSKRKITPTDVRIRETQVSFLQKWFMDIMTDHCTSQADYNDRHKKLLRAHMEVIGINKSDEEFDKMMREDSFQDDLFTEGHLRKTADAKQALADVTARHDIIIQIEKSLVEVHDLFIQMANMVEQQGDLVDVIERNVVRASEAARSGQNQLKEAKGKQSDARRKKIICYAILVIILIFLFGGVLYDLVRG